MALPKLSEPLSGGQILTRMCEVGSTGIAPTASLLAQLSESIEAIAQCTGSELYEQLTRAICTRHPHTAMQAMHDCGLLARLLPELDATVEFSEEAGRRHKDVWDHTKIVVWQSVPQPTVRWAAVLHDIGKVPTRRFLPNGGVTFHGHAELGERMFERGPAQRIAFPGPIRTRIAELIRWHQRPGHYSPTWTDAAVRRFTREVGPALDELLNLSRADITSKRPGRRKSCLHSISTLARRIRELELEARRPKLPPGFGRELMTSFDLPPGRQIGIVRKQLLQMCETGELESGQDSSYYLEHARELLKPV